MGIFSSLFGGAANDMVFVPGSEAIAMARGPDGAVESCPAFAALFSREAKPAAARSDPWRGRRVSPDVAVVGAEARAMRGSEPPGLTVVRVLKQGGFPDPLLASDVLRVLIRQLSGGAFGMVPPRAIFACLSSARNGLKEAAMKGGARDVIVMPPAMAAAIGAGLVKVGPAGAGERANGTVVFVLERDWCALAVIRAAQLAVSVELTWGLDQLLEDVAVHALATRGVVLEADALHERFMSGGIAGRELLGWEAWLGELETGRATQTAMSEADLRRSARPFALRLDGQQRKAMASLPAGKAGDAAGGPLHFFGPYVRVPGLAGLMEEAFHRQVVVAPGAETAMVRGGQKVLRELKWLMKGTG